MTNNNLFFEYVAKAKPTMNFWLKMILSIVLSIIGVFCFLFGGFIHMVVALLGLVIICAGIGLFCYCIPERKLEYEYTFTNGTIEIAAVYNLSRRKELFTFEMNQVTMILPTNSLRISNDKFDKKRNYTSGKPDSSALALVVDTEKAKQLVMMDINDKAMEYIKMVARSKMYND